jgi:hypothetical protein
LIISKRRKFGNRLGGRENRGNDNTGLCHEKQK